MEITVTDTAVTEPEMTVKGMEPEAPLLRRRPAPRQLAQARTTRTLAL